MNSEMWARWHHVLPETSQSAPPGLAHAIYSVCVCVCVFVCVCVCVCVLDGLYYSYQNALTIYKMEFQSCSQEMIKLQIQQRRDFQHA